VQKLVDYRLPSCASGQGHAADSQPHAGVPLILVGCIPNTLNGMLRGRQLGNEVTTVRD
jgi:hypothetical protein